MPSGDLETLGAMPRPLLTTVAVSRIIVVFFV